MLNAKQVYRDGRIMLSRRLQTIPNCLQSYISILTCLVRQIIGSASGYVYCVPKLAAQHLTIIVYLVSITNTVLEVSLSFSKNENNSSFVIRFVHRFNYCNRQKLSFEELTELNIFV